MNTVLYFFINSIIKYYANSAVKYRSSESEVCPQDQMTANLVIP